MEDKLDTLVEESNEDADPEVEFAVTNVIRELNGLEVLLVSTVRLSRPTSHANTLIYE